MQVTFDSQAAPDREDGSPNEDIALAGPTFALVLDGATPQPGVDSGCEHGVAWFVAKLGGELARGMSDHEAPLAEVLWQALRTVARLHSIMCDLDNPDTPSSTVTVVRQVEDRLEYLVLADSPLVVRTRSGEVSVVRDGRLDDLPGRSREEVRARRNVEGGFWVAAAEPRAAQEALTGSFPLADVATVGLFTDGASRLAERHGRTWAELLDLLETEGPSRVVDAVREADAQVAPGAHRGKPHDDATALLCRF